LDNIKSTRGNIKTTVTDKDAQKGATYIKWCFIIFVYKCGSFSKYLPSIPHLDGSILQVSANLSSSSYFLLNFLHVPVEDAKSILYLGGLK